MTLKAQLIEIKGEHRAKPFLVEINTVIPSIANDRGEKIEVAEFTLGSRSIRENSSADSVGGQLRGQGRFFGGRFHGG